MKTIDLTITDDETGEVYQLHAVCEFATVRRTGRAPETAVHPDQPVTAGGFTLTTAGSALRLDDGAEINLPVTEYNLLQFLMRHAGQVFSPEQLLRNVWGYLYDAGSPDLVRVTVAHVRQRLGPDVIQTVPGHGYIVRERHV